MPQTLKGHLCGFAQQKCCSSRPYIHTHPRLIAFCTVLHGQTALEVGRRYREAHAPRALVIRAGAGVVGVARLLTVVRKEGLYHPINFRIWFPKPCKTAKFFNPLNVFPMSPVFVTTPFLVQKALKTANSEKRVFSCQTSKVVPEPPSLLVSRRKPAPRVCRAPNSVFCPESLRIPAR